MARPVVGILSGISCVSGVDYYSGISLKYGEHLGKGHLMNPNPLLCMVSVDCDEYAKMLTEENWEGVREHLACGVGKLEAAGVDFLCIASNTGHISVPTVRARWPELPILHIADCTARAILGRGMSTVGLLGTEPTMREDYLKDQLALHGLSTIVPDSDDDLKQIFVFIMEELGFNVFKDPTRAFFVDQIQKLAARGAEGVILGCTEIELLELQPHVPEIPLFRSAELHIAAAARVCAGLDGVGDYSPSQ
jgi:aspartate racemase